MSKPPQLWPLPKPAQIWDKRKFFAADKTNQIFLVEHTFAPVDESLTLNGDAAAKPLTAVPTFGANLAEGQKLQYASSKGCVWKVTKKVPIDDYVRSLEIQRSKEYEELEEKKQLESLIQAADIVLTIMMFAFPQARMLKLLSRAMMAVELAQTLTKGEYGEFFADAVFEAFSEGAAKLIFPTFNPGRFARKGGYKDAILRNAQANGTLRDQGYDILKFAISKEEQALTATERELLLIHQIRSIHDPAYVKNIEKFGKMVRDLRAEWEFRAVKTFGMQPRPEPTTKPKEFSDFKFNPPIMNKPFYPK